MQSHSWRNGLKTLFNIVEERFKKIVELRCLCCIMMFRKVNKQPGMQKFWNWCSHYQEIYDWISPVLNKRAGSALFYSNTVLIVYMGGNEYGESGPFWPLVHFHSYEALNDAFEVQIFQGFIFTPYQRHWYHLGPCSSDLFKVKNC